MDGLHQDLNGLLVQQEECAWLCLYAPVYEKREKGLMSMKKFREDAGQCVKSVENLGKVLYVC